jgi:VWFA-related protein
VRADLRSGLAAAFLPLLLSSAAAENGPAQAPSSTQSPTQPPTTPPPLVIEADVNVVSVTAVITDKTGRFVSGLGTKDVELLEDGVKQEVTYFREAQAESEAERIPLSVVLVLDTSGSMVPNMRFLQEAATNFLYKLEENDTAMVVSFNESVKGSTEFTGDMEQLESKVNGLQAWGGTSLYDAVHYSLGRVKDQPGRKAVVVFSDGADTTSTSFNDQAVVDYAKAVEATIYVIGFRGSPGLFASSNKGFFRKLSDETGGAFFFPDKIGELNKIFNTIAHELKSHYLLSYSPQRPPDGSYRTITLRLVSPQAKDYEVRVRKGYFAMKRSRPPARKR